ncbi:diaminopimelate decarboxylase [Luminiphilus sp.]|nr:diaminopimelate decarboxylase [Luminiphilus sp.]MDA9989105.1 diaminopimelate decarboxylase [Luminiphilus sp.]MDB0008675.1 diaminopimelate decarboxylase [Luminiphilus sp.]
MATFSRHDGILHCEDVSLEAIATTYGTPTYLYSRSAIETAFLDYQSALSDIPHLICYAVKANSNLAILNVLAQLGAGFDVVSLGELERVVAAGGDPSKVVFSGVGKTTTEMQRALDLKIRCFNIESEAELLSLAELANGAGYVAPISIRVNPDVDAGTHPYISTGLRENKFGVEVAVARELYQIAEEHTALNPVGVDCHIGSQIEETAPFVESLECLLDLVRDLRTLGIRLQHIDLGGGLGVNYQAETPPSIHDYVAVLKERLQDQALELVLEPGRSIVAEAGALITEVLYLKPTADKHFAIVDAAMNDLLRPALYSAWQDIQPVTLQDGESHVWDVVGPICETGDFLGKNRAMVLSQGDLLSIMGAGAYGFGMASNYNSRPRVAEVMVQGETAHLIGKRENLSDLWQREVIPSGETS